MPNIEINISASVIAWVGAITGILSLLFQAGTYFRDRKKLKLKIEKGMYVVGQMGSGPYKEGVKYISINIFNVGSKEVVIDTAGARYFKGGYAVAADILKTGMVKLMPQHKHVVFIEETKLNMNECAYFYVKDATGKVYRKYLKNIWKLPFYSALRKFK